MVQVIVAYTLQCYRHCERMPVTTDVGDGRGGRMGEIRLEVTSLAAEDGGGNPAGGGACILRLR